MFDPFNDFETEGYLRNNYKEKDSRIVKITEHNLFKANLPDALKYLSVRKIITYNDFLKVHNILFSEFYPWAGQDRLITSPNVAVSKTGILFAHPSDAKKAVNEGLRLGQLSNKINKSPGLIMGLFAYGHPFLDGNGRTMLIIHTELAYRAGFSIAWNNTTKENYLVALSEEIRNPGQGILDNYLLQFKVSRLERNVWDKVILSINGLSGLDEGNKIEGYFDDTNVKERYRLFDSQRDYKIEDDHTDTDDNYALAENVICKRCNTTPCECKEPPSHGYSM